MAAGTFRNERLSSCTEVSVYLDNNVTGELSKAMACRVRHFEFISVSEEGAVRGAIELQVIAVSGCMAADVVEPCTNRHAAESWLVQSHLQIPLCSLLALSFYSTKIVAENEQSRRTSVRPPASQPQRAQASVFRGERVERHPLEANPTDRRRALICAQSFSGGGNNRTTHCFTEAAHEVYCAVHCSFRYIDTMQFERQA